MLVLSGYDFINLGHNYANPWCVITEVAVGIVSRAVVFSWEWGAVGEGIWQEYASKFTEEAFGHFACPGHSEVLPRGWGTPDLDHLFVMMAFHPCP